MAQLKDLIVNGASRFVGPVSADTATLNTVTANEYTITKISALTASATTATTYGNGSNGQVLKSNGTNVYWASDANSNTVPSAYCTTSATVTAKVANCTSYTLLNNSYIPVIIGYTNTVSNTAITLNINSRGAKPIYLNGSITSSTNYDLKAGSYIAYYDGTGYHFRTDGKITGNITGTATNVTGTVAIANGGTGATTADVARTNLGAAPAYVYSTTDLTAGTSTLTTGVLYFVYE